MHGLTQHSRTFVTPLGQEVSVPFFYDSEDHRGEDERFARRLAEGAHLEAMARTDYGADAEEPE